jgi:hypothetical protein
LGTYIGYKIPKVARRAQANAHLKIAKAHKMCTTLAPALCKNTLMLCQETFNNLNQSHARIAACASYYERLLSVDDKQEIVEMKVDDLPSEFLLTESQIERLTTLPQYTVQIHIKW